MNIGKQRKSIGTLMRKIEGSHEAKSTKEVVV